VYPSAGWCREWLWC